MNKQDLLKLLVLVLFLLGLLSLRACQPQEADIPAETQESATEAQTDPPETTMQITWQTYPADRELTARQAFIYDCETESFLYLLGSEDEKVYPASITKLFTAYVALQYLEADRPVTATDALDMVGAGSSVAEIESGNTLTVEMLVEAMLLPSGNDAAYILAAETGRVIEGDSDLSAPAAVSVFLAEMNAQAKARGMTNTRFLNPDGYHQEGHYSSFEDLAILGKLSLENETIMQYAAVSWERVEFVSGETKLWKNTNALVDPQSPYYCPYAVGLKTGQTPSAGSCLLSAFRLGQKAYVIGVFGCPEEEDRFADTLQLFNSVLEGER